MDCRLTERRLGARNRMLAGLTVSAVVLMTVEARLRRAVPSI